MLRSILVQLALQSEDEPLSLPEELIDLYDKYQSKPGRPDCDELLNLAIKLTTKGEGIYLFLDALDECGSKIQPDQQKQRSEQDRLMKSIKKLATLSKFYIICTSRREEWIYDNLTEFSFNKIDIQPENTNDDVRIYVAKLVHTDNVLRKLSQDTKDEIVEKLINGAQGMSVRVTTEAIL